MKTRQEIKALSKKAVASQRKTAILLELVFLPVVIVLVLVVALIQLALGGGDTIIALVVSNIIFLIGLLVLSVVYVNAYGEHVKVYRQEQASVAAIFTGLKVNFWRKLGGLLWMELWVMLWTLLLIIPGIIKSLAYSMTIFLLADHPKVKARQALKISMRMTNGHKGQIFIFYLSFLGWLLLPLLPAIIFSSINTAIAGTGFGIWAILTLLTFLAAIVFYIAFVYPYLYTASAGLYHELREKALAEGKVTHEELGMPAP